MPKRRSLLFRLDRISKFGHQVKLALRVLKSFVGSVKATVHDISIGIDIKPEIGVADSGDLECDLPELFMVIAEAAKSNQTSILLLIDEVQYFSAKELSALIMAMHKMQQKKCQLHLLARVCQYCQH